MYKAYELLWPSEKERKKERKRFKKYTVIQKNQKFNL